MNAVEGENYGLASLITQIAISYLSNYYDICVFWKAGSFEQTLNPMLLYSQSLNNSTEEQFQPLPPYRLYRFNDNATKRQEMVLAAVNYGCRVFFISTDAATDFSDAYIDTLKLFMQKNPDNRFILIPSGDTNRTTIDKLFNLPITTHIPDFLVIAPVEKNDNVFTTESNDGIIKYDIITTKFVGRHNQTEAIVLDRFYDVGNRFEKGNVNLFANKILNLDGRLLKLGIMNYIPFGIWKNTTPGLGNANIMDSDEEKNVFIDGTEGRLFIAFCEKYNCTISLHPAADNDWGETFPNGSGTGLLGAVLDRKVDVSASALYSDWYDQYINLDQSIGIQRSSMTILAPKPTLKPEWQLPALPFSLYLWCAVGLSFVVAVLGLTIVDYFIVASHENNTVGSRVIVNNIVFEVTSLFFGQSVNRILTSTPAMVIYGCILLISMIIDSAYTGGLSSFMAVPRYEEPIDTVHQLVSKDWNWGGTTDAWTFSILLGQQPDIVRLIELFTTFSIEQLSSRFKTGDYSYAFERIQYGHFAIPDYITLESLDYLRLMLDDVYYDYSIAVCYKTWPYKRMLNPLIRQLTESGLMGQWESQVALEYLDNHLQLAIRNSRLLHNEDSEPISLSTSHLLGASLLLLIGHMIAFIFFVGEIVFERLRQKI